MSFESLHLHELNWIAHLQEAIRSPFLDPIMRVLNQFDSLPFYSILIAVVWYAFDRKTGIRFFFLSLLMYFISQDLKELFAEPRPSHLMPQLGIVSARSYGFPSGAATGFTALFGFLALTVRKRWFWICSICFILLISFSRIYLGIHFFSDVIGGWIIGIIILAIYWKSLPRIEKFLARQKEHRLLLLIVLATLILSFLSLNNSTAMSILFGLGVAVGLVYAPLYPAPKRAIQRILRPIFALGGICVLQFISAAIGDDLIISALSHAVMGFWLSYGMARLCKKI